MPSIVDPVLDSTGVERLFPMDIVESIGLRFFPYTECDGRLTPAFSQPFDELLDYAPPAGDRKVWDEEGLTPESLMPFSPDLAGSEGLIVYHPFYMVMCRGSGYSSGVIVDGVSGRVLGPGIREGAQRKPVRSRDIALQSLAVGILPSTIVFAFTCSGESGLFGGALFSTLAAALAVIVFRISRRKAGSG